jgi:hypothetical protein
MTVISAQIQFDWLDGSLAAVMRRDPTQEGLDWTSIRDDLEERGLVPAGTVAAALNWRDAGKIGYALGPEVTMLCLCTDSRQFGLAYPLHDFVGQTVLVLAPGSAEAADDVATRWFRSVEVLPGSAVRLRGRVLESVAVLRGEALQLPPGGLRSGF